MENTDKTLTHENQFSEDTREALYQTIFSRRDVRGQFTGEPISQEVLSRILMAAHHAPSVGFMQPWNFIVIRRDDIKRKIHSLFETAHAEATEMFAGDKREKYKNLKLEGILESPVNICVTCNKDRAGPVVLGRTHNKEMDVYSTVCAVQNLWLAARAEGVGLGWVSILDHDHLRNALDIPEKIVPVAYLCLGYVSHFNDEPELQSKGWRSRLPLTDLVNFDGYGKGASEPWDAELLKCIDWHQDEVEKNGKLRGLK